MSYQSARTAGQGITYDVSLDGVRIHSVNHKVVPGEELDLRFSVSIGSHSRVFQAIVHRCDETEFAARFVAEGEGHLQALAELFPGLRLHRRSHR